MVFAEENKILPQQTGTDSGRVRLTEGMHSLVTIEDVIQGSVYGFDGAFEQIGLFNRDAKFGLDCKHDFLIVNQASSNVEIYFIEMKKNSCPLEHVKNQLLGGVALLSYIRRLASDRVGDRSLFKHVKYYAVALFFAAKHRPLTNMKQIREYKAEMRKKKQPYLAKRGIVCVENNRLSLQEMRNKGSFISLEWSRVNDFHDWN